MVRAGKCATNQTDGLPAAGKGLLRCALATNMHGHWALLCGVCVCARDVIAFLLFFDAVHCCSLHSETPANHIGPPPHVSQRQKKSSFKIKIT